MPFTKLSSEDKAVLLATARNSIAYGLSHQSPCPIEASQFSELLQTDGASFVTLNINQQLRGCIGTLEAYQPLILDITKQAYSAAFEDPRFSCVTQKEFPLLEIHLSILTSPSPMTVNSEEDLLEQLKPGMDGLILEAGARKATFLPSVWEQLTDAKDFLQHLKVKAGLGKHDWPEDIRFCRYSAIDI